jgi:hypothetical protein
MRARFKLRATRFVFCAGLCAFPQLVVNYVKLDRVPKYDDGWSPLMNAMRAGDYFVTRGEVLFRNYGIEGTGPQRY